MLLKEALNLDFLKHLIRQKKKITMENEQGKKYEIFYLEEDNIQLQENENILFQGNIDQFPLEFLEGILKCQ